MTGYKVVNEFNDFEPVYYCGDCLDTSTGVEPMADGDYRTCYYCNASLGTDDTPEMRYAEGFVFVNVYELDRVYGGAEEGGWYFTTGTFITGRQVPKAEADSVVAAFREKYPTVDEINRQAFEAWEAEGCPGRPPARRYRYDSVCYTGGHYAIYVEDKPGASWPEVFPHYE